MPTHSPSQSPATTRFILELLSGEQIQGTGFGAIDFLDKFDGILHGELVFQTGMIGYPEVITDPSFADQFLVMTYPLIGNYPLPASNLDPQWSIDWSLEANRPALKCLIVSEVFDPMEPKHVYLSQWLARYGVLGLAGVDTRYLTEYIRELGDSMARIYRQDFIPAKYIQPANNECNHNLVSQVSRPEIMQINQWPQEAPRILVWDFGIKHGQLSCLLKRGFNLSVCPYNYVPADESELQKYSGIFLSNGPGDPRSCFEAIEYLAQLIEREVTIPIFGICLGHQILALAAGLSVRKLKYGHRGQNIPCRLASQPGGNLAGHTEFGLLTSQNHGYEVLMDSSHATNGFQELFINANDGSNEGIAHEYLNMFSVQFHPEARPGPKESEFLFDIFADRIRNPESQPRSVYEHILNYFQTMRKCREAADQCAEPVKQGKVLIIGSGGLQIAQAGEFDYSGSQAIKSFQASGLETILINPNIATIQTSIADRTYYVPLDVNFITQVIQTEKPEYITVSFGGQTALNAGIALMKSGVLDKYGVQLLGTSLDKVHVSEDRQLFKQTIEQLSTPDLKIQCPPSISCSTVADALAAGERIGYPLLVRVGFCLGGAGSGFVHNAAELTAMATASLAVGSSMQLQTEPAILLDKSLRGWKELELEIMRDRFGNKLCICAMENVDPLGVHTGESIVVAPCQTLTDNEFQTMRDIAFKIADEIGIVGECNVQFTINPSPVSSINNQPEIYVIEMNARLSRSSALASKATGYPIAAIAAKLQLGYSLLALRNPCTSTNNTAFFEPALDYVVVKIPRWDLDKTPGVTAELGSAMKSVGEAMGIGRNFREALMKAIRMVGLPGAQTLVRDQRPTDLEALAIATPDRILRIFAALYRGHSVSEINRVTAITSWFLNQIQWITGLCHRLESEDLTQALLYQTKVSGLSDIQIASFSRLNLLDIADLRTMHGIHAQPRHIDTVAGEFPCRTNYMYLSYESYTPTTLAETDDTPSVIILGSGVYRIGSSVEFDWCAVETSREARRLGWRSIMINHNPETVSTDYDEADVLYFEELTPETVHEIWQVESSQGCQGVIVGMGGQAANNIVMDLAKLGLPILGTPAEMIDNAENRFKFSRMCDMIAVDQPRWTMVTTMQAAHEFCDSVGYPVLVRPSYVLSGAGMAVIHSARDLEGYLANARAISPVHPVVISQFISDAKEIEVDAVAQDGRIVILAISEHVENAGVHSGDASLVLPAQDLTSVTINAIKEIAFKIAAQLSVSGPMNIQLIAKDDRLRVIECNLRASRSFPFASRTLKINFIKLATQVILQPHIDIATTIPDVFTVEKVGVKVPMFSTARLTGAQVALGVEMQSTGEVACFGPNRNIAYLKALMSTGMRLPPMLNACVIFICNGSPQPVTLGYMRDMHWTVVSTINTEDESLAAELRAGKYHMVFILDNDRVEPNNDRVETSHDRVGTLDMYQRLARMAVDARVPVCINLKQAKLIIESIYYYYHNAVRLDSWFDIQLPDTLSSSATTILSNQVKNNALSPAVVANSMQCVSYKPDVVIQTPVTQIVFTDKHILTAEQFNRNLLRQIFKRASEIRQSGLGCVHRPLAGKVIGLLFYTPSTRTRCSFESAIKRLGGETILVGAGESSVQKGETLYDTIKALDCYTDGLVIRAPNDVDLMNYRTTSRHSVINAGDLAEHPTQSLLDLFTIREERGSINGLRIAFVGDLLNGRTVHSLVKMLCNYDVDMYFVAPANYMIPNEIVQYIQNAKVERPQLRITWTPVITTDGWLDSIAPIVDVVYMTRHQVERVIKDKSEGLAEESPLKFALNRDTMARLNPQAMVLHPLPRNEEIPAALDTDPRCKYFKQMEYGLYIRMALAELIFGR